jgi:hypothetical protein
VVLVYNMDGSLEVSVRASRSGSFENDVPDLCVESAGLSRALFETYLGSSSIVPDGRREWAEGARKLLESDKVRRQTRPGASLSSEESVVSEVIETNLSL